MDAHTPLRAIDYRLKASELGKLAAAESDEQKQKSLLEEALSCLETAEAAELIASNPSNLN